jgi:hypothetical protein
MRANGVRWLRPLLATVVLAMIVTPVAIAGAQDAGASRKRSNGTSKQLKALKKTTAALLQKVSALEARLAAEEAKPTPSAPAPSAPAPRPPAPTTALPVGPAGGDLAGVYPNPELRAGSVLSSDIADETITTFDVANGSLTGTDVADGGLSGLDIANGSIFGPDLAEGTILGDQIRDGTVGAADVGDDGLTVFDLGAGSVGASELVGTEVVRNASAPIGPNNLGASEVSCPPNTQLLSGGVDWEPGVGDLIAAISAPKLDPNFPGLPVNTWRVMGKNFTGAARSIIAVAICLRLE